MKNRPENLFEAHELKQESHGARLGMQGLGKEQRKQPHNFSSPECCQKEENVIPCKISLSLKSEKKRKRDPQQVGQEKQNRIGTATTLNKPPVWGLRRIQCYEMCGAEHARRRGQPHWKLAPANPLQSYCWRKG